ncbi:GntR family transcriptional regulator, partial [Parabacteroides sp. OttesenSCG-928-O15]|nr:GntR family transcriptional regulator [Parabacteroides sp. OttesenSCG-928-O15]
MRELPRYREIYETLRRQIADGVFVSGSLLPSENEMCRLYDVTRPTIRKALDLLTKEGFIIRHQGKGSIVKGAPKEIGILSLSSTTSAMDGTRLQTSIIVQSEHRAWDEAFTYAISEEEKQAGCIYFERVRILDGEPVILDITMLPDLGLPRFTEFNLENASLFDLLRSQYKITVTGGIQQLFAISADKRAHSLLRIRQGHPILQVNRKMETNRPGFYLYSQIFCVTSKYGLSGT